MYIVNTPLPLPTPFFFFFFLTFEEAIASQCFAMTTLRNSVIICHCEIARYTQYIYGLLDLHEKSECVMISVISQADVWEWGRQDL